MGGVVLAEIRLPLPIRFTRPGPAGRAATIAAWAASIAALLVCSAIYVQQVIHVIRDIQASGLSVTARKDPIAPVTVTAAAVVFVIIISRSSPGLRARLASAAIGAMAAPMIFELPFDPIVIARAQGPLSNLALFFVPLVLTEITTLLLLRLSPMVRLRRATFFSFALMLGVWAAWALDGFGYPSAPLPIALNVASKILAAVTALTLFLPRRPAPEQAPRLDAPAPAAEIAEDPQPASAAN